MLKWIIRQCPIGWSMRGWLRSSIGQESSSELVVPMFARNVN